MIRICILTANNEPAAFMDNGAPEALHYYNDTLHTFLAGSAYTFEFTADARHSDVEFLAVGNKLAFVDENDRKFYLNITQTEQDEDQIMVTAMGLSFELINENAPAYEATSAMTFAQYMSAMGYNSAVIQIGVNEVSDLSRSNKWESNTESRLARLFSLASLFDAEIEFVPQLKKDYSLDKIILNIYRAHSDQYQGMGRVREDIRLRYGIDIGGITRKADISNLYTSIIPTGKDGLDITSKAETIRDADGNVLYETTLGENAIRAVQARDQFPSNTSVTADKYIAYYWSTEYETVNDLYGNALSKLKEISQPAVEYEISGYADLNIGDTVIITDEAFNPSLYLEVRVTEQEISFTDPARNMTKFDNVTELTSQISGDLLAQVQDLQAQISAAQAAINEQTEYFFQDSVGVHMASAPGDATTDSNVLVKESAIAMRDGEDEVATFGSNLIELGKGNDSAVIDLCNGRAGFEYDAVAKQLKLAGQEYSATNLASLFFYLAGNPALPSPDHIGAGLMLLREPDQSYALLQADRIELQAPEWPHDLSSWREGIDGAIQVTAYTISLGATKWLSLSAQRATLNGYPILTKNDIKLVEDYSSNTAVNCPAGTNTDLHTYTVTEDGLYMVNVTGQISGTSGTGRYDFYVNTSAHPDVVAEVTFPTSQQYPCISATGVVQASAGDVIKWYTWCNPGYTVSYRAMQITKLG